MTPKEILHYYNKHGEFEVTLTEDLPSLDDSVCWTEYRDIFGRSEEAEDEFSDPYGEKGMRAKIYRVWDSQDDFGLNIHIQFDYYKYRKHNKTKESREKYCGYTATQAGAVKRYDKTSWTRHSANDEICEIYVPPVKQKKSNVVKLKV